MPEGVEYWDYDGPEIVYAEVDDNNITTGDNIVISAEDAPDEATGQTFCRNLLNSTNKFIRAYKTKPSVNPRKCFPATGYTYDPTNDWFKQALPEVPDPIYFEVDDDDGNKVMIYDHRGKSWTFDEEGWVYIMA